MAYTIYTLKNLTTQEQDMMAGEYEAYQMDERMRQRGLSQTERAKRLEAFIKRLQDHPATPMSTGAIKAAEHLVHEYTANASN